MNTIHREHETEMAHVHEHSNFSPMAFLPGLFIGAAIGATVLFLFAPNSGRRSRTKIQHRYGDFRDQMRESLEEAEEEIMHNANHTAANIRSMVKELEHHK